MFNWLFGKKKKVEETKKVMIPSRPLQKYATPVRTSTPPVTLGNRYSGNSSVDPIDHTDAIDVAVNLATELAYQHHISRLLNDPEPVSYGETMSSDTTPDTTPDTTASYSAPEPSSSYDSGSSSSSYDSGSSSSSYDSGSSDSSYSSSGGDF